MRRAPAVLAAGVVLVLVLGLCAVPWLLRDRAFTASTPTVTPLFEVKDIKIPPGGRGCLIGGVLYAPDAKAARFQVRTGKAGGPPLVVEARAPGYEADGRVPGGYRDREMIVARLDAPDRDRPDGTLCIRNAGREEVGVVATYETRYYAPLQTTVEGERVDGQMSVALIDPEPAPMLSRLDTVADRVAAFRPGWLGSWFLLPLFVAVLAGIPALVLFALARASAPERPQDR